ncbi:MAG: efflux RND transporter periplasmic adaptor subunit [Verrucomicrobiota bacterium]
MQTACITQSNPSSTSLSIDLTMSNNVSAVNKKPIADRCFTSSISMIANLRATISWRHGLSGFALLLISSMTLNGCDHPHEHDHDQPHEDHAGVATGHEGGDDHGHEAGAIAVTHFNDQSELFVEFPPLVVGEESGFAAHLTRLDNFRPVAEGRVTVKLSGGGLPEETFSVDKPSIPGIFRPVAIPAQAGERSVTLVLESHGLKSIHELGSYQVFADHESAMAAQPAEDEEGGEISFLKEQQWKVDFATAEIEVRSLRASVTATGLIKARKDGEVLIGAPTAGHLLATEAFPRIGSRVSAGHSLATILPRVAGEQVDIASLELAVQRARSEHEFAERERKRLDELVKKKAASQRALNEAENAERVAKAELVAATERLARYQHTLGNEEAAESTGIKVRSPIAGTLAEILVAAGSYVEEGDPMFHIIDTERLWLEANVAEADLGQLPEPQGAWFGIEGFEKTFAIDPDRGGQVIAFGKVVDPVRRTVPLVFEFPNPDGQLRVGMFAEVRVWAGESIEGLAVPASAIVDEAGQDIAYVMLGGEAFERRVLRLGIRDGDYLQVLSGLEPGERVVTRGAYLVRLAGASPAAAGHGHAH